MEAAGGYSEHRFAGFWRRIAAVLLDALIIAVVPVTWILVAILAFGPDLDTYRRDSTST